MLRAPRTRQPVPHRLALPRRYSRGLPPTVLDRQRRANRPAYVESVERAAQRVASAIRSRLLALRRGLLGLRRRLGGVSASRGRVGAY